MYWLFGKISLCSMTSFFTLKWLLNHVITCNKLLKSSFLLQCHTIASIMGFLNKIKRFLWTIMENLKAEISFAAHSVELFLTTYKSSRLAYHFQLTIKALMTILSYRASRCLHFPLAKTWKHYSEDITARWRDENITVSSFSLYYT